MFSGLRIDVEKVRTDNAAKTKATRKGGVIINTGSELRGPRLHDHGVLIVAGKLSIEEIENMKGEMARKYALTIKQQVEVDQKLNKLQNIKSQCTNNVQIVQDLASLLGNSKSPLCLVYCEICVFQIVIVRD